MSESIAINGEIVDSVDVAIDCRSVGLAYGYGVFETIKVRDGQLCFFKEHCDRLARSSSILGLEVVFGEEELIAQAKAVVAASGVNEGGLKVLCFRGKSKTEVLIHMRETGGIVSGRLALGVSNFVRSSQGISVGHKTLNYLENFTQLKRMQERGFDEGFFLNEYEFLTECCAANLFFVSAGKLKTPSVDCGILDGVIRGKVIQLAEQNGILVEEGRFRIEEIEEASEVFITNSLQGINSVERIQFTVTKERYYERALSNVLAQALSEAERASY